MALAGTLEIQMLANMARLADDMAKAKNIVGSSMKSIEGAVASAKSALGALGIGVSIGYFASLIKDTIHATAALDDMAEQTGATVEGLSKIQTVAKIGGHEFGGITEAIGKMIKGLKGADEVGQAAAQGLEFLGIKAKDSNGRFRDSAEILQDVAKALAKYEDGGNKVALVQDILGKSGAKYLSLLKDMAEEGEQQAKVTAQQAAEAEKLEKEINRLKIVFEDLKRALVIDATPALTDWIEANREAIKIAGGATEALRLFVFNLDAMTTEGPVEQISRLTKELEKYQQAGAVGKFMQSPTGFIFGGREEDLQKQIALLKFMNRQNVANVRDDIPGGLKTAPLTLTYETAKKGAAEADSTYRGLLKTLKELLLTENERTQVNKLQITLDEMSAKQRATITPLREAELKALAAKVDLQKREKVALDAYVKEVEAREAQKKEMDEAEGARTKARTDAIQATDKAIEQIEFETRLIGLANAEREIAIALREMETRGIQQQDAAFGQLAVRLKAAISAKVLAEENKKAADEITEFWKSAAHSMQQSMSSFFFDIMQGDLKDLAGSFKRTIDKMVADQLAAKAATELFGADFPKGGGSIGGWIGKALGAFGGGGFGDSAGQDYGMSFASGTAYVPRTGLALVHQGERIIPAAENRAGGEISVTNVFHITGPADRRSQAQIAAAAGEAVQRAMARNT